MNTMATNITEDMEDYKEKYENAVNELRNLRSMLMEQNVINADGIINTNLERIFPELKEDSDERIVEDIIAYIRYERKSTVEEIENRFIPWLEKQGEQKDSYTKQQLRDMGFAFTLNGDIVTPEKTNEAIKEYLAYHKKKWEKEQQKPFKWDDADDLMCTETLYFIDEFQKSDRCLSENEMQNSVSCEKWLKSLKERMMK